MTVRCPLSWRPALHRPVSCDAGAPVKGRDHQRPHRAGARTAADVHLDRWLGRCMAVFLSCGMGALQAGEHQLTSSTSVSPPPVATAPCQPTAPQAWEALSPDLWVWRPAIAEVGPDNGGRVTLSAALLYTDAQGLRQALVVDPGPSRQAGEALAHGLRCASPALTLNAIVLTHAHAENVLASDGLRRAVAPHRVPLLASTGTAEAMRERCPDCLAHLIRTAGAAAMARTEIDLPDQTLQAGDTLGPAGWQVQVYPEAHTHSDLVLWQPSSGHLLTGGLAYRHRLPELMQGSLRGWVRALDQLAALHPRQVVGIDSTDASAIPMTRRYLCGLSADIWQHMNKGQSVNELLAQPPTPVGSWSAGLERHAFNLQRAWRELETDWMAGRTAPCSVPQLGG